jgi:hypothetical protein
MYSDRVVLICAKCFVSMIHTVFVEYPLCIDLQLCELLVRLIYLYDYSKHCPWSEFV